MTKQPQDQSLAHLHLLVSGASVAGPALALQLARRGARVTVVERAPALRPGGFAVDFRGHVHRKVLQDMGIWEEVHARQTHMGVQTLVDADGSPRIELPAAMMSGDVEIARGELAAIMYERTRDLPHVTYVFGDSVASLHETPTGVDVTFEKGAPDTFDLVVGADGLHSRTRALAFGDESRYLTYLGYCVAGFDVPNHLGLDRTARIHSDPGRMVGIGNADGVPSHAGATLVFSSPERLDFDRRDLAQQQKILTERFRGMGWEAPRVLEALGGLTSVDELYFDAIAQIHVDRLSVGRVVLVGDAGYGATMGGMGTGAAVVAAYVLAGELAAAGGDHRTAFAAYEAAFGDFAKGCQKIAGNAGPFLAPPTARKIRQRDLTYRMLSARPLAGFFKKLTEKAATDIVLRDYP
ncbi:FAD-dependent oxidoreductase [Streptomyces spiroverticillatus]|uniref:FAD-dependent oxidoreductase n=1 Tax=Streptomyces finlayi TaxID=67296 RepID=A0A918X2L1_9ACTN|nr:FAD-dependent monooxygenase [Streptomyces finlayi]GHA24904.1 FAD-dependent oxidoreductase [Streptomyces spiroverticillatus]GHD05669.1 FAD-dependent oxidoreductase [Streptomyces finlayi]